MGELQKFFFEQGDVAFVLALFIFAGYKRWIVWGYQLETIIKDRDEWKQLALSSTGVAEKAVNHIEKVAK